MDRLIFGYFIMCGALGCTPSIGDRCTLSTDCSIQGTRLCDTSQPNGYCTMLGCTADSCPDHAACVEFGASVSGCPYDDYGAPSRLGRAMCMKTCSSNSDCRQSEGYGCVDPKQNPSTAILDTNQAAQVCMITGLPSVSLADALVCSPTRPDVPPLDATAPEASGEGYESGTAGEGIAEEAESDVAEAAPSDVTTERVSDGQAEATLVDAPGDAGAEGVAEAAADSGAFDAPPGS